MLLHRSEWRGIDVQATGAHREGDTLDAASLSPMLSKAEFVGVTTARVFAQALRTSGEAVTVALPLTLYGTPFIAGYEPVSSAREPVERTPTVRAS